MSRIQPAKGNEHVTLVEPHLGKECAPFGTLGRWTDPTGNSLFVRSKPFNATAAGTDAALIAAVPDYLIVVLGLVLLGSGTATDVTFTSKPAGSGVAVSPVFSLGVNTPLVIPVTPLGWLFASQPDQGLSVTTGAGTTVHGIVLYALMPSAALELSTGAALLGADALPINL